MDFEQIVDDVDNLYNEQLTLAQPTSPQLHPVHQPQHHLSPVDLQQQQAHQHVQLMTPQQQIKLVQQPQVQLLQSVAPQQLKLAPGSQIQLLQHQQQLKLIQQVNQHSHVRLLQPIMSPQPQMHLVQQHPSHQVQLLQQLAPQQQLKLVQQQQQQVQLSIQPMSSSLQQINLGDSLQQGKHSQGSPGPVQCELQSSSKAQTSSTELSNASKVNFIVTKNIHYIKYKGQ